MSAPAVSVDGVGQTFGKRVIFQNVSFDIAVGEIFVVLGGSGCGKSTLLKQMIGLLSPTAGQIRRAVRLDDADRQHHAPARFIHRFTARGPPRHCPAETRSGRAR
jgi:ABC-type transporter Mla maintaining outer membrane lipid asymmetry ATPase subunit MlaF